MTDMKEAAVRLNGAFREYSPGRGIRDLSLSIMAGECLAVMGKNGSGKSTLTRLLVGLEPLRKGEGFVLGFPLHGSPHRRGCRLPLDRIGYVPDIGIHWESLTAYQNAYFIARSHGIRKSGIAARLSGLFALADLTGREGDQVKEYSFGMRRKLSIIEALCHDPELLVLDEPTTGIDPQFALRLSELIRERGRRGRTTFIAGNDPEWIAGTADRAAFLHEGRTAVEGRVDELMSEIAAYHEVEIRLETDRAIPAPGWKSLKGYSQTGRTLSVIINSNPAVIPDILSWVLTQGGRPSAMEVKNGTLRDLFLLRTGRSLEE